MSTMGKQTTELRKNKKALSFVLVIGLCALGLVLWALGSFGTSMAHKRALIHHGVETTGIVTAHTSQFEVVRGGGFEVYQISYTFSPTGTGQTVTKKNIEIDHQDWQATAVGSKLSVTYLASNPSENEPTFSVTKVSPGASLVLYVALGFLLIFASSSLLGKHFKQKGSMAFIALLVTVVVSFALAAQLERALVHIVARLILR